MEDIIEESLSELDGLEEEAIAAILLLLEDRLNILLEELGSVSRSGLSRFLGTAPSDLSLIEPLEPDQPDQILESFQTLFQGATSNGLDLAERLSKPSIAVPVAVSVSAAILRQAALRARGYIEEQARSFSESVSTAIGTGLIDPSSPSGLANEVRRQYKKVQNKVNLIVRTESARIRNQASLNYYTAQGFQLFVYYVTLDERLCPFCAAQAGRVFKPGAIAMPRHWFCRCYLVPYAKNAFQVDSRTDKFRRAHRKQVLSYIGARGISVNEGPAPFDLTAPLPNRKDAQG